MKTLLALILVAALAAPTLAQQSTAAHDSHHSSALADGEVRKIDKEAKKITLRHGPLPNLDMPAMTMVFQVKDPAMLDQVKPGEMVKFQAEKIGGAFTIIQIEPSK